MKSQLTCRSRAAAAALIFLSVLASPAAAEVERVEIEAREAVAEGRAFGLAGPYEKLRGKIHFVLDPAHAENAGIVDLDKAPRGEDGRVRFSSDFYVLQPRDPERGNGAAILEVSNRGSKAMVRYFCRRARRTFDPSTIEDFGDAFLLRRGFTLAWVGWQMDVPDRPELLRLHGLTAETEPPLEGLVRADHVFAEDARVLPLAHRRHRPYPVADPDDPRNVLTVRDGRLSPRRTLPRESWRFARLDDEGNAVDDPGFILLEEGVFERGKIYEAVYVARHPRVIGLGMAAIRDLASHLKHGGEDRALRAERVIALGISQTGRFLRTFLYQGFNRDEAGRRALDGVMAHTAGAGRGSFNHRFAQPSRDAHRFSAFVYPTDIFPFTGAAQTDPETGRREGLFDALRDTAAMPKVFFTNSGYEYWGRAAALIHTTLDGTADIELSPDVRIYHFASAQHFVDGFPPRIASTRHPANPADFLFVLRALLVAMDGWLDGGTEPPASRYPRIADGTLVVPGKLGFPAIPGVEAPLHPHEAYRADYGERFRDEGIVTHQPPRLGKAFPALVPRVDRDGNELGGLRLPEVAVPVATYTPWNWRAEEIGAPHELADFRGAFLLLPRTHAEAESSGDPRRPLAERYHSRDEYLGRFTRAAVDLVGGRYLLAEDLPELVAHAEKLWSLAHGGLPE